MKLPFYKPTSRSTLHSLLLLLLLMLLVLTGLGVFRLYFGFDWLADEDGGELFNLRIRGGNAFNLFEAAPFGRTFWVTLIVCTALALLLPRFKPIGASLLALLAGGGIVYAYLSEPEAASLVSEIPLEFSLLTVLLLFVVQQLLGWMGERRDQKRMRNLLNQYVPTALVDQYQNDPAAIDLASEQRDISVLFCDVIGFSAVAETLSPQDLASWLNEYFTFASRIVVRHRGTIDKYMGDSVMAVWGAPARSQTHEYDALCAALDIQQELESLNRRLSDKSWPELAVGVGVASGPAMVGPLGSDYRRDYTVIGDTVNIAQRIEAETRRYGVGVIVSDRLVDALPDMLFRELDTLTFKGRQSSITLYEALGRRDSVSDEVKTLLAMHREAMAASRSGNWQKAWSIFSELRVQWGPSRLYDLYLKGIEQVAGNRVT